MATTEDVFDPFGNSPPRPAGKAGSATSTGSSDVFDPFGLGTAAVTSLGDDADALSTESPQPPPDMNRTTRSPSSPKIKGPTLDTKKKLPPKLLVKLSMHEEVSSIAKTGVENEGSSEIVVDGTLKAQLQCSDARRNAPFALISSSSQGGKLLFRGSEDFVTSPTSPLESIPNKALHIVRIPKTAIPDVVIGKYTVSEEVRHMPILLERKVTTFGRTCRIMVQVRSKLNNLGDMQDFTIAVAIPERVDGETVEVTRGDGVWDELKRTIKWKLADLPKGESFMVSAQAELWAPVANKEDKPVFPVLMRCSSSYDKISSADFKAAEADGSPATVTYIGTSSFRLLHRLT